MKISDALMYIVQQNGGRVDHTQFNSWVGQLVEAGYLEIYFEKDGESVGYQLTDKGQVKVNGK